MYNINIRNLNVKLNDREILRDINLSFQYPSLYFILGQNGSGKSTLLRAIANLIPFEGEITINGKDIRSYKRKDLSRLVGYVWQNPLYGFFEETVEREIKFIIRNLDLREDVFEQIVNFFNINHLLHRSPFTLSGGEAKRVSISSVIVADQPILLLDEPESEMDLDGLRKIISYLRINASKKLLIVATHNPLIAYKLRDIVKEIYLLKSGRIFSKINVSQLEDSDLLELVGIVPINWWYK